MKFNRTTAKRFFRVFILITRLAVGCLFIYGSLYKIRQPYDFLSSIYSYELVGPRLGMFVAMTLPWLELFVGICLVGGIFIGGALLATAAMAAMFAFTYSSVLYRGLDIACGCFIVSGRGMVSYFTVICVVLILLFSIVSYIGVVCFRPCNGEHGL